MILSTLQEAKRSDWATTAPPVRPSPTNGFRLSGPAEKGSQSRTDHTSYATIAPSSLRTLPPHIAPPTDPPTYILTHPPATKHNKHVQTQRRYNSRLHHNHILLPLFPLPHILISLIPQHARFIVFDVFSYVLEEFDDLRGLVSTCS